MRSKKGRHAGLPLPSLLHFRKRIRSGKLFKGIPEHHPKNFQQLDDWSFYRAKNNQSASAKDFWGGIWGIFQKALFLCSADGTGEGVQACRLVIGANFESKIGICPPFLRGD